MFRIALGILIGGCAAVLYPQAHEFFVEVANRAPGAWEGVKAFFNS